MEDGPRGPAEIVSPGAVMIAQRAGVPILPYALSVKPASRLSTWDRLIIPYPFARGAIVYGEPILVSRDSDPQQIQAELQKRLDEATRRADMLGLRCQMLHPRPEIVRIEMRIELIFKPVLGR